MNTIHDHPVIQAIRYPEHLAEKSNKDWDRLLKAARWARVLSRIDVLLGEKGEIDRLPERVVGHLEAARRVAHEHRRMLRWETNRIQRALRSIDTPIILLKGAAYNLAKLPPARGRLSSDIDILVPKGRLELVEKALIADGWETTKHHPYDQRFYRSWMHELPPLRHSERGSWVDIHHNILPETGRTIPNPDKLIEHAVSINGDRLMTLSPVDMILHCSAHMFQDGELYGAIRELIDLDDLLRHFGENGNLWEFLVLRATELGLQRPLFYALRFSVSILASPVPDDVISAAADAGRPKWPISLIMDWLVNRVLIQEPQDRVRWDTVIARWILFLRSHWLRMPFLRLISHLCRKLFR